MAKRKDLSILQTINAVSAMEISHITFAQGSILSERYEVEKLIGVGGMGAVYLVKDRALGNDLKALKIMLEKLVCDETARKRFRNEILISQKLSHPNILRVYDFGEYHSLLFFTMEYMDGPNLREWFDDKGAQGNIALGNWQG